MSAPLLRDDRLKALYARVPGMVAFVDESIRSDPYEGEVPFYSMTAVLFRVDQLEDVRDVLTDIAQGRYWHTEAALQKGQKRQIFEMTHYISEQVNWGVVVVQVAISDKSVATARATCLSSLLRETTRGSGPDAVRLVVADSSTDVHSMQADQWVAKQLRRSGLIDPNVMLYHGRMGDEPVLWSADVVSWSAFRNLAVDDDRWIAPLMPRLSCFDAATGIKVNMKRPQAAYAPGTKEVPPPGVPLMTGPEGGPTVVASEVNYTWPEFVQQDYVRGSEVMEDIRRQIANARRGAGLGGVARGNSPAAVSARPMVTDVAELPDWARAAVIASQQQGVGPAHAAGPSMPEPAPQAPRPPTHGIGL